MVSQSITSIVSKIKASKTDTFKHTRSFPREENIYRVSYISVEPPSPFDFLCNLIYLPLDGRRVHLSDIFQAMSFWAVWKHMLVIVLIESQQHFYLKIVLSHHHKL